MKETFENLSEKKQQRVIKACIEEFGEHGYDSSSMDGIIKRAGISKGGLYEYVSSKEELFKFIVDYTYTSLYNYLNLRVHAEVQVLPPDLLERLKLVSELAIDFYIDNPEFVQLIVRTSSLANEKIAMDVQDIFEKHFLELFGDADISNLRYSKERILELSMWLLLKTRYDFLKEVKTEVEPGKIKQDYMDNWDFFLGTMKSGIYHS
ncbi:MULTISPECIES: TetR/AcrR family transcriptional regulator [unclassified Oceanispirochaeta]|uniref:TetR/AcrR family transcriptional regulator n=1 Tax=unclassified Oceanispirochaeta TaxID=2635722 RepID=UPI00131438C8|nr:TetR/AcrR family transcriptional regulator [Oceanispirochaeta sp. M1]MBF9016944.1 TetR/AcrR family transcriptional regulator [Oceanispirochaeta sp. M2]NPD73307.1 TetR/AcrR family transcriptional regulator [Oceanispirochaeta sp. M1]